MSNQQWLTSLHEAGHCVAALALGGRVESVLRLDDAGMAHSVELEGGRDVYMTAAGPAAEALAEQYDPPAIEPIAETRVIESIQKNDDPGEAADWVVRRGVKKWSRSCIPDDRRLALWAIGGYESEPDRWASRVAFARHIAAQIVDDRQKEIVRIAERLYQTGFLTGDEVSCLFYQS